MAEELAFRPPANTAGASSSEARGTFPAGTALAALSVWFLLSRVLVRVASERPAAARVAVFAGVLGAVLGVIATLIHMADGLRERSIVARVIAAARLACMLPVGLLVSATMMGEPTSSQQWAGLFGAAGLLWLVLVPAVVRAREMWLARMTLVLLLVGESIELGWPPAHIAFAPGTFWPRLFGRLGAMSEMCALVGAILAFAWAVRSTRYVAGWARTRMFLPLPVFTAALLSMLSSTIPPRIAVAAARHAFGVRFDLVWSDSSQLAVYSIAGLMAYLLIPELLIGAAAVSVAAITVDRGAAPRRALGWIAILFAGFGALRLSGPMDPIRLVLVSLGVVLLERSVLLDVEDHARPAATD